MQFQSHMNRDAAKIEAEVKPVETAVAADADEVLAELRAIFASAEAGVKKLFHRTVAPALPASPTLTAPQSPPAPSK